MLHNDISNRESPILAFNIDNLLFAGEPRGEGVLDKLKFKLGTDKYKYFNRKLNSVFVSSMFMLWEKHNYSIYFVTKFPYEREIEEFLSESNICYTRLMKVEDIKDMRQDLNNRFTYYFDTDGQTISVLSSAKAVQFSTLWEKVGRV